MSEPGRLFLSVPEADFDPDRDRVLGPWCFVGAEQVYPQWESLPFVDPFPTPKSWVDADHFCRQLALSLVPEWADKMNARHHRSYSTRFWRVLLLNWLTVAVPALWSRYHMVQALAARDRDRPLHVTLAPDCPDWRVGASIDLIPTLWSRAGDFQLSSFIVRALAPPNWTLHIASDAPTIEDRSSPPRVSPGRWGRLFRTVFGRLPVNTVPGSNLGRIPLSVMAQVMPRVPAKDVARVDLVTVPEPFGALLSEFLDRVLPRTFTSGFAGLEAHALAQAYHPGRLLVDVLNSEDDHLRVVTAMAYERGERLVGCQHGGTYGTHRGMMASAVTEYPYHAFLTWGWDQHSGFAGNFVPAASPLLGRMVGRHSGTNGTLVLVGGSMVVHGTRMGWLPKPQQYLSYRRAKLDFIGGLTEPVRAALRYRPYRRNVTVIEDADFVHRHHPGLPLIEGDLDQAIMGCRLLVLDHPITTMLTAMAANIPTILYWERDAWLMADSAEPYFQQLRDAGILFHDAAAAAAKVNAVWDDVPGWWNSTQVQAARWSFAHRFARTSRWWWWGWLRALWRLSGTRVVGDTRVGTG